MLQDFSVKRAVADIQSRKALEQEIQRLLKKAPSIEGDLNFKKDLIKIYEEESSKALVVKQKAGIFSRIASLFRRGNYFNASRQIAEKEQQLKDLQSEVAKLEGKQAALSESLNKKNQELSQTPEMPGCMQEVDGELVITDKAMGLIQPSELANSTQVEPGKKVLVHCTNFFPKDNVILSDYNGEKIGYPVTMEYHGVKKEVRNLVHRHEVHCTINNRVENTGAGEGKWDNPSYIVIDRYDVHQDEIESYNPSDTWTKGTNIKLSKNAVIMVRLQDKGKIPVHKDDLDKYNIVYYDGDPTFCLKNFLKINGYEIFQTDPNYPGHSASARHDAEYFLGNRDRAINFVKDNTYFPNEPHVFSVEELAPIVDVGVANIGTNYLISPEQETLCLGNRELSKDQKLEYLKVAKFVIGSGLRRTEDGGYTFASDEEVLSDIKCIRERPEELPNSIDTDLVNEIFEMQQEYARKYAKLPRPSFDQISSMQLGELYQFKNQLACETLQSVVPFDANLVGSKTHVSLKIDGSDITDIAKKVRVEDGIHCDDFGNLGMNLGLYAQAENVPKAYSLLEKKKEEIRNRSVTVRPDIDDGER